MPLLDQKQLDDFAKRMKALDAELAAIEAAAVQARRLRLTPPVDDDFPLVKHEYDASVRTLVDALRNNGRLLNMRDY